MLKNSYFNQDPLALAKSLLGKVIRVKYRNTWLSARIIETEAYCIDEKASHASLGFTEKRKALFMPPGTIYMYYSRGGDSMNISARGEGSAVLIKSGFPYIDELSPKNTIKIMQRLNPQKNKPEPRPIEKLCSGQTLLCKSLNIKVVDWDAQNFCADKFYIEHCGIKPKGIIATTRLGIPEGRDEHLPYRFIDKEFAAFCTKKPKVEIQ